MMTEGSRAAAPTSSPEVAVCLSSRCSGGSKKNKRKKKRKSDQRGGGLI